MALRAPADFIRKDHDPSAFTVRRMALCWQSEDVMDVGGRDHEPPFEVLLTNRPGETDAQIERLGGVRLEPS